MTEYLFTSGSCLKKNLYDTIINLFKANGWTDISKNERIDGIVLSSPSTSGDRNLIFQVRPHTGSTTVDVRTTDYHTANFRLLGDFTPAGDVVAGVYDVTFSANNIVIDGNTLTYSTSGNGVSSFKTAEHLASYINLTTGLNAKYTASVVDATRVSLTQKPTYETTVSPIVSGTGASVATSVAGVASFGVTTRPAEAWKTWFLEPVATATLINKETVVINYKYNVNANRLILVLEYPGETGYAPALFYIGLPDEVYTAEAGSTGLLFAASCANPTAGTIAVTNNASEYTTSSASIVESCLYSLAPKNPNAAGKFILSELSYGGTLNGVRGKFTGMFILPNQGVLNGDIIQEGARQFQVVICQSYSSTAFPTAVFAIQIA